MLKEMGLLALQLAGLNPVTEESEVIETFGGCGAGKASATDHGEYENDHRPLFEQEVERLTRLVSGRRKTASIPYDEFSEWLSRV